MIDRRLIGNFDWVTFGLVLIITITGVMTIYSATRPVVEGADWPSYYSKQMYWIVIGLLAMFAAVSFDYSWLRRFGMPLYWTGVAMLVLVLLIGRVGMGAQRWLAIGPVGFQPSEFFKLAFIIAMAGHLGSDSESFTARKLGATFLKYMLLPLLLILKQPDLGTATVIFCIFMALVFTKGIRRKLFIMSALILAISIPFVGAVVWDGLKPYQKKRITAFLNPDEGTESTSYHVKQSKIAVGSGGLTGKGYLEGTQGPFRFLPEKHTDFIFAAYSEEHGFIGGFILLMLYLALILRGLHTAQVAKDPFGRYLALGVTYLLALYCIVNVAMTVGFAPVVGIPLPFMSYGGTAIVTNFLAVGILINVRARRFELFY